MITTFFPAKVSGELNSLECINVPWKSSYISKKKINTHHNVRLSYVPGQGMSYA